MVRKPVWQQHYEKCKHFNGLIHKACDAGIAYKRVMGNARRAYPCFRDEAQNAPTCPGTSFPTYDEAHAYEEEIRMHVRTYFAEMGKGTCPHCHQEMWKSQVGNCVYANPCGHRLYQGRIV